MTATISPRVRQAALLCILLGPEGAGAIVRHLPLRIADQIGHAIVRIGVTEVPPEEKEAVLRQFIAEMRPDELVEGGPDYLRRVFEHALEDPDRVEEAMTRFPGTNSDSEAAFASFRKLPARTLLPVLKQQDPQTIAVVFRHLDPLQAGQILSALPDELKVAVVQRMLRGSQVKPEVLAELERVLKARLMQKQGVARSAPDRVADILNMADETTSRYVIDEISKLDPELGGAVRSGLFLFSDLPTLPDAVIQRILREVDLRKDVAYALYGAEADVTVKIFTNISRRNAEDLQEQIAEMTDVNPKDVEAAQSRIIQALFRLVRAGDLDPELLRAAARNR